METSGGIYVNLNKEELYFSIIGSLRPPNHVLKEVREKAEEMRPDIGELEDFAENERPEYSDSGGYVQIGKWKHIYPESQFQDPDQYRGVVEEHDFYFTWNPGDQIDTTIKGWFDGVGEYYTPSDEKPNGWNEWP